MAPILCILLCLLIPAWGATPPAIETVTLDTKLGKVKGVLMKSEKGRDFKAFTGIPFAKPPVDELRFQPPEPADPWGADVLDATKPANDCPQANFLTSSFQGQEDCLALNIYAPITKEGNALPVMVFIHGGGFVSGTGAGYMYGPHRFMEHNIVLVTIQYRLGLLGFLNTEDEEATGNYGMLDQVLALRWVKDNIGEFGGDKTRVTIFGESAGGVSVMYHLVSPLSKGLFDSAIAQSGSPLTRWAFQKNPLDWAKKLAATIECPTDNTKDMVECFRGKTAAELIVGNGNLRVTKLLPFNAAPSIDRLAQHVFLPKDPLTLLQEGKVNNVPVIAGIMADEGYAFYSDMARFLKARGDQFFEEQAGKYFPLILEVDPGMSAVFDRIRDEYFGDGDVNDPSTFEAGLSKAIGHCMFDVGVAQSIDFLQKAGIPVRTYIYNQISNMSTAIVVGGKSGKYASHGDELFIQFVTQLSKFVKESKTDKIMGRVINTIWANFASGSYENLVTVNDEVVEWPLYAEQKPLYLELNVQPSVKEGRISSKVDFWTKVIPKLIEDSRIRDEL